MGRGNEKLETLAKKIKQDIEKGAAPSPVELTVREFIGWYGKRRRGSLLVSPSLTKERAIGGILPPFWPKITRKLLILGRRS